MKAEYSNEITTCQWDSPSGWGLCGRALDSVDSTFCILHDPNPTKDHDGAFSSFLWEKIDAGENSNTSLIDLSGVIFPNDVFFGGVPSTTFNKDISFDHAQFRGRAGFDSTKFKGDAYFRDARFDSSAEFDGTDFKKDASFGAAQFCGRASFSEGKFGGAVEFTAAEFSGVTFFLGSQFSVGADFMGARFFAATHFLEAEFAGFVDFSRAVVQESLNFRGSTFLPNTESLVDFSNLTSESGQRLRFVDVDLSRVLLVGTDVSQIQFIGCTWAKMGGRRVVYDEIVLDKGETFLAIEGPPVHLIAQLYRQLRLNYESNRQEVEAGDFYVGQMEMRRQDTASYSRLYRGLLSVYRVLAMYGESYQRPVFFYFTFGLVFALLYLWGGFQVGEAPVRYGLGFDPGNVAQFGKDLVRAYVQALTAGGILGANLAGLSGVNLASGEWWVPLARYANMLLDTFLVGFFAIALRRHFRR